MLTALSAPTGVTVETFVTGVHPRVALISERRVWPPIPALRVLLSYIHEVLLACGLFSHAETTIDLSAVHGVYVVALDGVE